MSSLLTHVIGTGNTPFPVLGIEVPKEGKTFLPSIFRWAGYIPGANFISGVALVILGITGASSAPPKDKTLHQRIITRGIATALFGPLTLLADIIATCARIAMTDNSARSR